MSLNVTYFESTPFFSPSATSLQGEHGNEESPQSCLPSYLLAPISVYPSIFYSGNEKELQMYTKRDKDKTTLPPPITSWDPDDDSSNLSFSIPSKSSVDYDLLIAFQKGKRACTNHHISNFVSYQALINPYVTFVNSVSSVKVVERSHV